jgi:DNA-binding response OmpR family regulator
MPTALLVEDDPIMARMTMTSLGRGQFEVVWMEDGSLARDYIQSHPPTDLVILDYMMPGLNGEEVLVLLRAQPNWTTRPVMMMTVVGEEKTIARLYQTGLTEFYQKPIRMGEFVRAAMRLAGQVS